MIKTLKGALISCGVSTRKANKVIAALADHAAKTGKNPDVAFFNVLQKINTIKFEQNNEYDFGIAMFCKNPECIRAETAALSDEILRQGKDE